MRNWDGTMATDSAAPTVAYYSREELEELLLKAKLGDDWKSYRWFMKPVGWRTFFRTSRRDGCRKYANYNALLTAAVEAALDRAEHAPTGLLLEVGTGTQGRRPASVLEPLPGAEAAPLPVRQPLSGDEETVKQVARISGRRSVSPPTCQTWTTRRSTS